MLRTLAFLLLCLVSLQSYGTDNPQSHHIRQTNVHLTMDTLLSDSIQFHPVRVDRSGAILPWYSENLGVSYDHVLNLIWKFWNNMEIDSNGVKYYLNHDVWSPNHDKRGIGGDQIMMALSSWDLFYDYSGDRQVLENMRYIADFYLAHSLSPAGAKWPDLPYPQNIDKHSGIYNGDMVLGKNYLQPDKAASFGFELLKLYKKTGDKKYLTAAVHIANTLAAKIIPGDNNNSPWPFKVNAITGEIGILEERPFNYQGMSAVDKTRPKVSRSTYTTNWTAALNLFSGLKQLNTGNDRAYTRAFQITLNWLKKYPVKTNKWGPFFEDISGWSDSQINGITYAMFVIEHPEYDTDWKNTAKGIFNWVYRELANNEFKKYGVICINEQTAYRVPGNSHTSREASVELMYTEKSGDTSYVRNAVRQLNWATYMVNEKGMNKYLRDDIWLTDGYGDYVRHYLRAMAAMPNLAPDNGDHLLRSSSIVKSIDYLRSVITYNLFDNHSQDIFRLTNKPVQIRVNGKVLKETIGGSNNSWTWESLKQGGILKISQSTGDHIQILF